MSTVTLHIGDVFEQLAKIPDGSIDLIVTSPPFLALRSYLPDDGSGTTLVAAHNESRDAIGIDLDDRNVAMVEDRLGPLVAACDLTVNTAQEVAA